MAGHHMPASAGRPAAGEQGEAAHRRYTSSGTGRHDVRTGLHGRHASSAHCGGGGDHMDTSTFQRPGPGQQHPRVPGGELEGRRDQHAADTSSYTSRASRSGASADRGESSARRGRVNESWIPPPSGRSIQLHGWPGRTALIILALGLALLAPGAGAQQCQTTGPEGFTVVCSASGAYVEISGGSSWRRCIKKICAPYPQSPGTLVKGLAGADPASLFYGETVSVECVSEAGVFYTPRGTGSNTSTCLGDCSFTATTQCVLATTCAVNVTAHGVGEALFLVEGSALAFGVVPQEVRRSVVAPLGGRIFNQEPLRTTCQAGFRSSTSTHASGGACALTHSATCQPTGLLSPTTQTCQAVRCPAHQEICEYEPCGADQNTPVGVPTPTSLLSFNEMVTVDCNKGYFFTPNGSYAPSCTQLGGDNFYDVFPKLGQLTCGPVCQTPKNGRRCEPLPCPCITPPPNAFVLRNDIRYWETVNVTCDPGFALSTTTAEECSKDAPVTCSLNSTSTGVGVYPTLPDTQCAPAPCGAFPHPASSSVRNSTGAAGVDATYIHGDVLRVTCDAGRRGVYGDAGWASCANVTGFGVACSECAFNVSYACARVLCPLPDLSSMFSAWLNSTTRAALVAGGGAGGGGERGDDPLYGDSITYACIEGYRVESYNVTSLAEVEVACDAECGLATPTCLPVQCPAVTVANSVVVTYSWEASTDGHTRALGSSSAQMLFEDSVTFRCDAGFIAAAPGESGIAACVDELTMTCNSSAVLAGGEATCVAMACNVSDLAFVGSASVLIVALGSDTTVTCEDGYRAVPLDEDFAT
ncbi:hypothetical protein T484DRAFT_3560137 [Baffinella frigidus]|nr:hypothetical protein T484DRAFT_3560137 [Cryptophyta sp. CCMP2293]